MGGGAVHELPLRIHVGGSAGPGGEVGADFGGDGYVGGSFGFGVGEGEMVVVDRGAVGCRVVGRGVGAEGVFDEEFKAVAVVVALVTEGVGEGVVEFPLLEGGFAGAGGVDGVGEGAAAG